MKLLLEYDADPTIEIEISTMYDDYTQSAIQAAYKNGHSKVVKLLQNYLRKKDGKN